MDDQIEYITPTIESLKSLCGMARQCFTETFSHLYEDAPFAEFLNRVYGPGGSMENAFQDPQTCWQIARTSDQIVGYAKVCPLAAPAPAPLPGALELQQIYVLRPWHGCGVADHLMNWALNVSALAQAPEIYLTVCDDNERAKRFYSRHGFEEVGHCTFQLGDRIDDDRIWRKVLGSPVRH